MENKKEQIKMEFEQTFANLCDILGIAELCREKGKAEQLNTLMLQLEASYCLKHKNINLIPTFFQCGGIKYEVRRVEKCTDYDYGSVKYSPAIIEIADRTRIGDGQSDSCKVNTFFHELVHTILNTMREDDLQNERFVSTFASFLTEVMVTAEYKQ